MKKKSPMQMRAEPKAKAEKKSAKPMSEMERYAQKRAKSKPAPSPIKIDTK